MRKSIVAPLIVLLVVVIVVIGYIVGDIYDVFPGVLTTKKSNSDSHLKEQSFPAVSYAPVSSEASSASNGLTTKERTAIRQRVSDLLSTFNEIGTKAHDPSGVDVSLTMLDTATSKIIAEKNSHRMLTPASTNKLLTVFTALNVLGPSYRFTTSCSYKNGSVYLHGNGDQLLARESGNHSDAVGYAGIKDLAQRCAAQLQAKNITAVNVKLDDSFYGQPRQNPDWAIDHVGTYGGPVDPMEFDTGKRDIRWSAFYPDPAMDVGKQFAAKLGEAGIKVQTSVAREKTPQGAIQLAHIQSASLEQVVDFLLTTSNNVLAENVCFAAAAHSGRRPTFQGGVETVRATLRHYGVPINQLASHDCSGLSPEGKVSSYVLALVLQLVAHDKTHHTQALTYGLPIAGYTGTLNRRFRHSDIQGILRALSLIHI